jgi:drug/metabolite transporter (DMT)-like permease
LILVDIEDIQYHAVMSASSIGRRDVVFLTIAAAAWGIGTVVSKRAVGEFPPVTLLPIQLAGSLAVLVPLMRLTRIPLRGSPSVLARLGVLNPGIAYALSLIGLASISASLSVLLWATEPLLILLLAGVVLRERIGPAIVVGSTVAVAGMVLLLYQPAIGGQWPGIVLTLAGIACCAVYTVIARRFVATADSTAQVVLAQQAYALAFALATLAAAAMLGVQVLPSGVTVTGIASAVGSGVLYYAAAYWFYLIALRTLPASLAASSFYLIPIFGVAGGYVLLGERIEPMQWLGALLVVGAVVGIVRQVSAGDRSALAVPATGAG